MKIFIFACILISPLSLLGIESAKPLVLIGDSPIQLSHADFADKINLAAMKNITIGSEGKPLSLFDLNEREYQKFGKKILGPGCVETPETCNSMSLLNYSRRTDTISKWLIPYGSQSASPAQNIGAFFAGIAASNEKFFLSFLPAAVQTDDLVTFVHGTHVAGIASQDLPAGSVIAYPVMRTPDEIPVVTLDDIYTGSMEKRTGEDIRRLFAELSQVISISGVRVFNFSWSGNYESLLLRYKSQVMPASNLQIKAVSDKIKAIAKTNAFETQRLLREMIRNHPGVVFVVAAGNENRDLRSLPGATADLKQANALVVGSLGGRYSNWGEAVNVRAPGLRSSSIPLNRRMNLMGTSVSTPAAANFVAKLFLSHPEYTPTEAVLATPPEVR